MHLVWATSVFAVAGVLFYALAVLPPGEPCYEGKPLHHWLWLARIHNQSLPLDQQDRTRAAVVTIATNNSALLLRWFREEEPPWSEPAYRRGINWLLSQQRLSRVRPEAAPRPSEPSMAYSVFYEYPEVAATAIPEFVAMLTDKEDLVKGRACLILARIGKPAIPIVVPALASTNDIARALAAEILCQIGTNALPLRPRLETMLNDKSIFVRLDVAEALSRLHADPEIIVPVILACFHEGDRETRMYAMNVLSKLKERAISAVPDITNSLASVTNSEDRMFLMNALREINPEQAGRFAARRPANTPPEDGAADPDELIGPTP